MELEGSLPWSQEPASAPYPEPQLTTTHHKKKDVS
jgi:hypothetical protein